jgi:hypothetical protein
LKLHGSTEGNLISAIGSASRLRARPVHPDTIKFWRDVIAHARNELSSPACAPAHAEIERLVGELEGEIARRQHRQPV